MPSRIDEARHTKAFDYPVVEHWGESRNVQFTSPKPRNLIKYNYLASIIISVGIIAPETIRALIIMLF